jgi:hypothetical protein
MEPNLASLRLERVARELEKPHRITPGPLSLRALSNERDEQTGRFAARHTTHELLDGVAEVALAASVPARSISKAAWNQSRDDLGRTDLPTADPIRRRLGVSWPLVLKLAFTAAAKRSRVLGNHTQRPDFKGDDETICSGLRMVAHRVKEPLDRLTYDFERIKLDEERARRGRPPLHLPHSDTIVKRLRSWVNACKLAGVEAARPVPPPTTRARPAVETLDEFISQTGLLPYRRWFEQWCRAKDIPLGRDARQWDEVVAAVRVRRSARGEKTPFEPATRASLPPIPEHERVGRSGARRPKRRTREEGLASLRRYKRRHLKAGQEPRQKHYYLVAKKDRELLAGSTIVKFGRFQDLCREAGI